MKTFQEWANAGNSDLFEMANIITPEGETGRWTLQKVELEGPGVVNVLKGLEGSAGIHDLATKLVTSSKLRVKDSEGPFATMKEFAKEQGEPEERLLAYLVDLQKDQLRKQKAKGWQGRIAVINNKWTLQEGGDAPKKQGGYQKDNYVPKLFSGEKAPEAPAEEAPDAEEKAPKTKKTKK